MRIRDLAVRPLDWRLDFSRMAASTLIPSAVLACAALLWLLALRGIDLRAINDFGLVSVLPAAYFVGLAAVVVSFAFAVNNRETPGWLLFLHLALLICMIHGTPSLAYGTLRYAWAWKHVGMVDYIERRGAVNPQVGSLAELSANHNWPAFFALGALVTQAAGLPDALQPAILAPLFFNLINVGALLLVFGPLVEDRRLKWLAVWFFYLGNWIGQDYFAPQALSYFLFLVIVGLCLTWFATHERPALPAALTARWPALRRVEAAWQRLAGPEDNALRRTGLGTTPGQRAGVMVLILVLYTAITASHQLTPFMAILAVTALVVARRISPRSLPLLLAAITLAWILYPAWTFIASNVKWIFYSWGQLSNNTTLTPLWRLSPGQQVVAIAARVLTGLIGALGVAGLVRRWRRGRRDLIYALLAIAPVPMLAANSYGGEMVFRVYLFALPFAAFFAAALVYPALAAGRTWRTALAVAGISGVLASGLLLAYYGRERMNYFTPEEVEAARYLYGGAPAGSLVIGASYNYPSLFEDYERYSQVTLAGQDATEGTPAVLAADPLSVIARLATRRRYAAVYVILTRSQRNQIAMDNLLPPGTIEHVEAALTDSGRFTLVYANRDAEIYRLNGRPEDLEQP